MQAELNLHVARFIGNKKHPNRGYLYERAHFDRLELAMADDWERSNERGHGKDIIQLIFHGSPIGEPTLRDRYVAATIVQWMGTNCGFSFYIAALRSIGMCVHGIVTRLDDEPLVEAMMMAQASVEADQATFDFAEPS